MSTPFPSSGPTRFERMISQTPTMVALFRSIEKLGPSEQPVLITGESGTGKERAARALHNQSRRHRGPFIAINCGALSHHLAESELFGHVRGAFTGAHTDNEGALVAAHNGTLFLDEVGELPVALQPKLLRALENNAVRPVGASREKRVSVRVVAATHRNLNAEVEQGRFRLDLLYRLDVLRVHLPPLRHRVNDIPLLVRELLSQHCDGTPLTSAALRRLASCRWPGNIRELRNVLVRAALDSIGPISERAIVRAMPSEPAPVTEPQSLHEHVCRLISDRLTANGGEHAKTYRELAIPKSTFYRWLKSGSIGCFG